MILITGAGGKTGRAVVQALAQRNVQIRAWVRRPAQAANLLTLGADQTFVGDLQNLSDWASACQDIRSIYHICPNMHPDEIAIGQLAIDSATAAGSEHFVYHSVLHPQTEEMPHHWHKLRVEEMLLKSGLDFTILQPAAYMQNILAGWQSIVAAGEYRIPYRVDTRLGMVDLLDVAQAAVVVLTEPGHMGAIYELATAERLSQTEVAAVLSSQLKCPVRAVEIDRQEWAAQARSNGLSEYAIDTLLRMFRYYESNHFYGNGRTLTGILNQDPSTFEMFVQREFVQ